MRTVVFVVPVGVHLLDLAGPAQVFSAAADHGAAYRVLYIGERSPVPSHQGVALAVDTAWPPLTGDDLVVVTGHRVGDGTPRGALPPPLLAQLAAHHGRGGRVSSVCADASALAEAGLLDHRRATTHHDVQDALARRVGLSERTLTRRFRAATGLTPLRYQQSLRLEHAEHLLVRGATAEAAARTVGFGDARMLRRLRRGT